MNVTKVKSQEPQQHKLVTPLRRSPGALVSKKIYVLINNDQKFVIKETLFKTKSNSDISLDQVDER